MDERVVDLIIVMNRGRAGAGGRGGSEGVGNGGHVDKLEGRGGVGREVGVETAGPTVATAAAEPKGEEEDEEESGGREN